ncbi:MAG: exosortase family protein XrtF [Bacteroidota bacterium]
MIDLFNRYRTALLFLIKFISAYVVLNIAYGAFVELYNPRPDPVTVLVTAQTSYVLNLFGANTHTLESRERPNVLLCQPKGNSILSVYEGCNGLNVVIVFLSFLVAFRLNSKLIWFIPLGIFIIHLSNLVRIALLYYVGINLPDYSYFAHKYLFTASIFLVVFGLWFWWLKKLIP